MSDKPKRIETHDAVYVGGDSGNGEVPLPAMPDAAGYYRLVSTEVRVNASFYASYYEYTWTWEEIQR